MFPMVSEPWEYEAARGLFVGQRAWLASHNKKLPVAIRYGAMLEVPGLVETLDLMLPHLDFLSVGTNDLTQFLFAADRAHSRLAERYDWLSPIDRKSTRLNSSHECASRMTSSPETKNKHNIS